jgi:HK97 family phage major capsid protein
MSLVKQILEQRATAWEEAKAMLDTAEAEGRSLSAEETGKFDAINGTINALDEQRTKIEDAEKRAKDAAEAMDRFNAAPKPEQRGDADADEKLRAFLRGDVRSYDSNEGLPPVNFRDLTKGSATAGGNTIRTGFREQLLEHMIEVSGVMMAGPTVLNTTSGESIEVPITTSHGTAALTTEGSAISESDPAFGKRTLGAYKYATLVQVSRELVDDTSVDLLGYIARQAGRGCGNALGTDLVVGNASSKPSGIVQTASTGVTGSASVSGAFTADNLIDLFFSVIAPYRNSPSCGWMMKDTTLAAVRKLKDTTNQYLWQPSIQVGVPDTLLGKPVHTDPNVAAVALSAKSVIFGDFAAYFVRLAGGVRFERSDEYAFNADLVTFKAVVRGDGILADQTGAVKVFLGNAA